MGRVIDDGDLLLRPLVARDAGELFMLADTHRQALRRYMSWVDNTTAVADMSYYILTLNGLNVFDMLVRAKVFVAAYRAAERAGLSVPRGVL